jgi:hypothetical protein
MRLHLSAIAAAALALTAAAPAAAAPATILGGTLPDDAPFALRLAKDGRTLTSLLAHVRMTCDDGRHMTLSGEDAFASGGPAIEKGDAVFPRTRLSKRGVLRADGTASAEFADATGAVTERLRGTVRDGHGRGTLSATMILTDNATGARQTCRSGALRWTAFSNPGHIFAGATSDGRPIVLQRSRDGRKVDALWVSYTTPCQNEGGFAVGEELMNFPLRSGAFGDTWTFEPDKTISVAYTLRGRVGAARASGSLRVQVTVKDDAGATTDTCDSTPLSWSARSSKGAKVKRAKEEIRVGASARVHMGTS